jgi:hypothetical protein
MGNFPLPRGPILARIFLPLTKRSLCKIEHAKRKSPAEERGKDIVGTDTAGAVLISHAIAGYQLRLPPPAWID